MIKQQIEDEINNQIQAEFQSAWLYLGLAAWFEGKNLDGFANWMKHQWREEQEHAMKFYEHLIRRGGTVKLQDLEEPQLSAKNATEAFENVLEHERYITKCIHKLYDLAKEQDDYPLEMLLHWFIDEQVEEEENASSILERLQMIGESGSGLYVLDRELAKREE